MRVNGILSLFSFFDVCRSFVVLTVDQFVGRNDGPLEKQRQDIKAFYRRQRFMHCALQNHRFSQLFVVFIFTSIICQEFHSLFSVS